METHGFDWLIVEKERRPRIARHLLKASSEASVG